MKIAAVRKLIGKRVVATRLNSRYYVDKTTFTLLAIKGKNILVDYGGNVDWLWLPDWHLVEAE